MKRIFILSAYPLFGRGVESLLGQRPGLKIVGREVDVERAVDEIRRLAPDVVILDASQWMDEADAIVGRIMAAGSGASVVGVNLQDNVLCTYRRDRRTMKEVEDLVDAVIEDGAEEPLKGEDLAALASSRSQVYGFLAAAYNRLPDDRFASSLQGEDLAGFLVLLAAGLDLPPEMSDGLRLIESYARASAGKPVEEVRTDLAVERTRLVRGIKPGYGPPPPYEGVYAATAQEALGKVMLDVQNIYAESGVVLPEDVHDRPDFIGFELDFMRYLTEKEAQAWAAGNPQDTIDITEKEQAFLNEHINRWVPHFCDAMLEDARLDFYRGLAHLTKGYVQGDVNTTAGLVNAARAMWGGESEP